MKCETENTVKLIDPCGDENYTFAFQSVKKASENRHCETEYELGVNGGKQGRERGCWWQREMMMPERPATQAYPSSIPVPPQKTVCA